MKPARKSLRQVLRKSDVRCRYGGDEFLVMLPDTNESGALRVAEWLRAEMEQIEVKAPALYQAKAAGRNCVRSAAMPARSAEKIAASAPPPGTIVAH